MDAEYTFGIGLYTLISPWLELGVMAIPTPSDCYSNTAFGSFWVKMLSYVHGTLIGSS